MCALRKEDEVRTGQSLCRKSAWWRPSWLSWSEISFETSKRGGFPFLLFFVVFFFYYDDRDFFVVVANQEARSPSLPPDFTFFLGFRKRTDEGRGIECCCHLQKENTPRPILGFKQTPVTAQDISLSNA